MIRRQLNPWKDERGTTAIEFALVSPLFVILTVGAVFLCLAIFTALSLRFAVKDGARCASVRTTQCSDTATTIAYTQSRYKGPGTMPNFTYDPAAACGRSVSGSINYVIYLGVKEITVPLTATACFPA
jgi:Flp pilus assembly pilin Flp